MSKESAEKQNSFRIASDPILSEETKRKGSEGQDPIGPTDKLKFEDLGALPTGYGEMFAIARDPHWLFTYWDFDYAKFPTPRKLFLEVYRNEDLESTIEINEIARNWYIPVNSAATTYTVVFGYRDANECLDKAGQGRADSDASRIGQPQLGHTIRDGALPSELQFPARRHIVCANRRPTVDGSVSALTAGGE